METVIAERTIAAPIEEVFDWCATTTNYERSLWVLRAKLARPGQGAAYGVGAIRVHTWLIGRFHEPITAYHPPHSFDYVVDRSFPPSRHEGGSMTFTETPDGTCVRWSSTVEVALPIAAGAATRWIAKPVIAHVFGRILHHCDKELSRRHTP